MKEQVKITLYLAGMKTGRVILSLMLISLFMLFSCKDRANADEERKPISYYVDSEDGNDANDGRSENQAWRSLFKAATIRMYPGDSLRFKRGSVFAGSLVMTDSGNSQNYIVLTDYGDPVMPAPSFTNTVFDPGENNFGNCIRMKGSFILVENLFCHHTVAQLRETAGGFTTMWELGAIYIDKTAQHCIIRNNELYDCGVGIKSYGSYARIENNFIHDCNRVLKEWTWGPIGIWLGADFQEVCYNRIFNYRAVDPRISWGTDSYGGGADGGAIEIDDARVEKSNISIHHNYTRDCQGFLEVTWTDVRQNPPYRGFEIHHNISDDFQQFIALWRGADCRIENNTIIRRKKNVNDWGVFNITQYHAKNLIRNNIVVVENDVVVFNVGKNGNAQPFSQISNNLYFAASGALNMGKEGPGAMPVFGDPEFINYKGGSVPEDFFIADESPAIDKGMDLGYEKDFNNTKIPQGETPDIGIFEFK